MIVLGLRFSLDTWTNFANSPNAAWIFWGVFLVVAAVAISVTLWVFRHARPH